MLKLYTIGTYAPPKDWTVRPDGSFVRELVGGESFMAWMHEHRSGGVSRLVVDLTYLSSI